MDDFRWENHAIRTARPQQRERRRSLTKKLMVYYEARATAVNIRGLTGFSAEGILENRARGRAPDGERSE